METIKIVQDGIELDVSGGDINASVVLEEVINIILEVVIWKYKEQTYLW